MPRYSRPKATTFTVQEPTTLLAFILSALSGISRNKAKAIVAGCGVTVNRKIQHRHDFPLATGDVVEVGKRKPAGQLNNPYVKLVFEDTHIAVIEKSPGILSMAAHGHQFSVKSVLDDYFRRSKQRCTAHVVHRLDRETSGLLVYAKTIQAEQILEHNWREIVTDRRYMALVGGVPEPRNGTVESWLKDNKAYYTMSYDEDPGNGAKFARTHYRTLRTDGTHSLVELKLDTGRKNQIRAHMLRIGHPVCGDIKYGGREDDPTGRLALHAYRLNFFHPISGEPLQFETPVPKAFGKALKAKGE